MDSWVTLAATALGGGAFGSVTTGVLNYMQARAKQPVDQYDGLVTRLQGIILSEREHFDALLKQEREHCDSRITRLEKEADLACQREQSFIDRDRQNSEKIGELTGRLDEQRRTLNNLVKRTEETATQTALLQHDHHDHEAPR